MLLFNQFLKCYRYIISNFQLYDFSKSLSQFCNACIFLCYKSTDILYFEYNIIYQSEI